MMRYRLPAAILSILLLALAARAADVSPQDKAFFEKNYSKLVKIEPHPLASDALGKVFAAAFFSVDITFSGSNYKLVAARAGDDLKEVTLPSTDADMPDLKAIVKPAFKIAADADAKTFEAALDLLYPINPDFGPDDLKAKTIKHAGDEWTFVRGKFFDHFKGFVIKTNPDGTIAGIRYSLQIP